MMKTKTQNASSRTKGTERVLILRRRFCRHRSTRRTIAKSAGTAQIGTNIWHSVSTPSVDS